MSWTQVEPGTWRLAATGFSGKAVLNETNSGYIAVFRIENTDFDMELVSERDFFEHRDEALSFLKRHMQQHDH